MKPRSFFRSKTFLTLLAVGMVMGAWHYATFHLYSLPDNTIAAFQAITTEAMWGIIALAGAVAGVKGWMDHMSMKLDMATTAATKLEKKIDESRKEIVVVDETAKNENLRAHREEQP